MKTNLSVKIPLELKEWLYEYCEDEGLKVSAVLITLIEYLKTLEEDYKI